MGKIVKGVTNLFGGQKVDTSQAAFKPYAISTPAGSSYFDTATGKGGVTFSPELQSMWDKYLSAAEGAMPSAEQTQFAGDLSTYGKQLFGTSIGMDTNQMAKDYYNQQQAILEPTRAQESSRLNDTMFSRGTLGAGVGMGEGYINPQQYALQQARGQQDLELALASTDRSRAIQNEDIQRALGFYGMGQELAYQPYAQSANILGYGTELQNLALPSLGYGLEAGQASASAGANIASLQQKARDSNLSFWGGLLSGGMNAYKK